MVITAANFGYLSRRIFEYLRRLNISYDGKNISCQKENIFFKQSKRTLHFFCFVLDNISCKWNERSRNVDDVFFQILKKLKRNTK